MTMSLKIGPTADFNVNLKLEKEEVNHPLTSETKKDSYLRGRICNDLLKLFLPNYVKSTHTDHS